MYRVVAGSFFTCISDGLKLLLLAAGRLSSSESGQYTSGSMIAPPAGAYWVMFLFCTPLVALRSVSPERRGK